MPQPATPEPGQESVWDYPRPPQIEASSQRAVIICKGITIADSCSTQRVLETSHPPVYYFPPQDVRTEYLELSTRHSYCEWKGEASYYHLNLGDRRPDNVAWYYPTPNPRFSVIKDYIAFYPSKMDACYVDEELVTAQPGDFYGGWITSKIVGPFKGGIGTWGW
ncbi:DUF427 domain-containing protein [Synechocystis salina LEGE 06155]|nr:DUF427 domain-containing protein [Synechocystis salina LEGE 06155]